MPLITTSKLVINTDKLLYIKKAKNKNIYIAQFEGEDRRDDNVLFMSGKEFLEVIQVIQLEQAENTIKQT